MKRTYRILFFVIIFKAILFAESIETFYGFIDVEETVLLDLIKSPALQRLKFIHQYGVAYYTTHKEEYNRFDHSLGVLAILKHKGASLQEQMAGLLHDVSHTVFSHVGDWVFQHQYAKYDYQTSIHRIYLFISGVEEILNKHGYTIEDVLTDKNEFLMLEQALPNLCADRIDYNIQGAYYQNFLTKEEALALFEDLRFIEGRWISSRIDLIQKITSFSLYMTENCWGSAINYVTSQWLADAILKGLQINLLSWKEFHQDIDQEVWEKLNSASNLFIRERMHKVFHPSQYCSLACPSDADFFVKFKCRGIDPWVLYQGKVVRLLSIDENLKAKYEILKEKASQGWPLKWLH